MKLLRAILVLLLTLTPLAANAQNFPTRDKEPVVDNAKLLSAEQVAQLTQLSEGINKDTTRQFVVATIPDLQGYDIADYGYQLLRHWGLGQKDADNGLILIVAPNERKVRIEVGYGLEPIMTDALSSQIINQTILPKFKAGDMPGGIVAGAQAIAEQLKLPLEAAEAKAKEAADKASTTRSRNGGDSFPFGLLFIGVVIAFVVLPMIFGRRRGKRYRGSGGDHWPIILWSIANEIGRNSGGGGGSSWGGGGGSDWGGGGGGFSGGGGSGGGGGASGSW